LRTAPAVHITIEPDRTWQVAVALLLASAASACVAWAALWLGASSAATGAMAAAAAAVAAFGARRWLPAEFGQLGWDGSQWLWSPGMRSHESRTGRVRAVYDFGPWMLLRFDADAAPRCHAWLPLSRTAAGSGWHGLRAAVYSRRPEPRTPSAPRI
jgi:hypothetical protein